MSNINIQIREKDTNGYVPLYIENSAANIGGMNVNSGYNDTNALTTLQNITNKTIAPDGAYWEEANLTQYASETLDWSLAHICNVNDFYVIACPYDYTDPDTQEHTHKFYIYYSSDGGYNWTLTRQTSANTSTKISKINNMAMQATSIGYRLVILGTNEESPNVLNSYSVLFVYNATGDTTTAEDGTIIMPFTVIVSQFVNSSLITEIDTKVYNSPQGFMALSPTGKLYLSSYLYDYKFSTNGIANGESNFGYFNWTLIGELSLPSSPVQQSFVDAYFDSRINRMVALCNDANDANSADMIFIFSPYFAANPTITTLSNASTNCTHKLYTAFDKTFIVRYSSNTAIKVYVVVYNIKNNNYELKEIDLPDMEGHSWVAFGGNKHRFYAIRDDGVVAYMYRFNVIYQTSGAQEGNIDSISYNWRIANQSADTKDRMFISLKNYQLSLTDSITMNICCSTNNNDIVGIYHNIDNNVITDTYILHTHTNNAQ